jgi:chemotaxis protein methyltransferase CheR
VTERLETMVGDNLELAGSALSDHDFRLITRIALDEAGLAIPETKKALVQSRLSRHLRALGIGEFAEYIALVSLPENREERRELVSVLTTNVSSFFRERHHFDHFSQTVWPRIAAKLGNRTAPARIWSAGCSSGQEPYSIAMECLRAMPDAASRDLLILASDIDPVILQRAAEGRYTQAEVSGIPERDLRTHFTPAPDKTSYSANDTLRRLVRFRELNLHSAWPMRGQFEAIFCRNVLIYFDEDHQRRLWPRFHDALVPGGFLFLGHSERIHPLEGSGFTSAGVTIYRKS